MWTPMRQKMIEEHTQLRDKIRKQAKAEKLGEAELLFEAEKLFKPITESVKTRPRPALPALPAPALVPALPPPPTPRTIQAFEELPHEFGAAKPDDPGLVMLDPDVKLDVDEIENMGFKRPSKLKREEYGKVIDEATKYNKHFLGTKKRDAETQADKDTWNDKLNIMKGYIQRLRLLEAGTKLVSGKGLKMINNKFGDLDIDGRALNGGRLKAFKDGKLVMDEAVDHSLYNLLTKRYDKRHNYSNKALEQFKKLIELAGIGLYNKRGKKAEAVYYSDPNHLVDKLTLLIASKQAGNTGVGNDISAIIDELLHQKHISKREALKLYKNLV